jgi:hypothetical protein
MSDTFNTIHIITADKDEPIYKWIERICPSIIISEGLASNPRLDTKTFEKGYNQLFFDT